MQISTYLSVHGVQRIEAEEPHQLEKTGSWVRKITFCNDSSMNHETTIFGDTREAILFPWEKERDGLKPDSADASDAYLAQPPDTVRIAE